MSSGPRSSSWLRLQPLTIAVAVVALASASVALWLTRTHQASLPSVNAVAFSSDGRFLAAGDRHSGVTIWRVDSFQIVNRIHLRDGGLNTLAFSPNVQLLAVAGRSLQLWSTLSWKAVTTLGTPGGVYGTARFSPDGRVLASVNASERIELWDTSTGKRIQSLCCMALYGDVAFSPDGRVLLAGGHWPRLWDISAGREIHRLVESRDPTFGAVSFRPDGQVLATGSQDGKARLWEVGTGRELLSSKVRENYVESVAFHPSGELLAYAVREGPVWLWDTTARSERMIAAITTSNLSFSPDGRWLAFGVPGGSVHLWDVTGEREGPTLPFLHD